MCRSRDVLMMLRRAALGGTHLRRRLLSSSPASSQLKLAPEDFFVDELSGDNFLRGALAALADAADAAGERLHAPLAAELARFWAFLTARFGIDVVQLRREQLEEDDEAPVLVLGTEEEAEALGAAE